ncbi:YkgJ family cysteine cluster protein [Thiohalocapsa marina]|uniref:YkgJ family cysteine cluster protein n=1 Tax=Thiohalocapsa marina TaxID=424902 RepID=A0A5M8FJ48_9GAMM|nr:YkgJ family cysteine cluster protein [Thiohalocapsa marina]KAA6184963.1 YkgJ family cysteine cluster protein [Thiohalocapsa marina]
MTDQRIHCPDCAAVCCRLEVLCITDTGVPRHLTQQRADGVETMVRLDDGWCAALDRVNMHCSIYDQRPLICRELEMGGADCIAERQRFVVECSGPAS